ncbi:putative serine/threonine-protein kinase drkB [Taenia solium]|eukprot:TsM_001201000 transcript=TsM_001201000 gene=TsM_001201000
MPSAVMCIKLRHEYRGGNHNGIRINKHTDVKLGRELGRGNIRVVYLGSVRSLKVALKKSLTATNDEAFREEARLVHILSHPHIVRFLGFCCDAPDRGALIITEFMPSSPLLNCLHTSPRRHPTYQHLNTIIVHVGTHCRYLTSQNHTLLAH